MLASATRSTVNHGGPGNNGVIIIQPRQRQFLRKLFTKATVEGEEAENKRAFTSNVLENNSL